MAIKVPSLLRATPVGGRTHRTIRNAQSHLRCKYICSAHAQFAVHKTSHTINLHSIYVYMHNAIHNTQCTPATDQGPWSLTKTQYTMRNAQLTLQFRYPNTQSSVSLRSPLRTVQAASTYTSTRSPPMGSRMGSSDRPGTSGAASTASDGSDELPGARDGNPGTGRG